MLKEPSAWVSGTVSGLNISLTEHAQGCITKLTTVFEAAIFRICILFIETHCLQPMFKVPISFENNIFQSFPCSVSCLKQQTWEELLYLLALNRLNNQAYNICHLFP